MTVGSWISAPVGDRPPRLHYCRSERVETARPEAKDAATRDEALELTAQPAFNDTDQEASSEDEMQFDPWAERVRALRPQ